MVHIYSIDDSINKFSIGCMINPSFHINRVFREQFEKFLSATFHVNKMKTIICCLKNKNTCVIALIMFYDNNGVKPKKCIGC